MTEAKTKTDTKAEVTFREAVVCDVADVFAKQPRHDDGTLVLTEEGMGGLAAVCVDVVFKKMFVPEALARKPYTEFLQIARAQGAPVD